MKQNHVMGVFILSAGLSFLFSGCNSAPKPMPGAIAPAGPAWVNKGSGAFTEKGGKVFHGVGAISGIRNKPLATSAADNRARAEITKIFETYTASLMKDYTASTGSGEGGAPVTEEQHVEQATKTFSAATLSGITIIDHWRDPSDGTLYSLARLDMEEFKNSVTKMNQLNSQVRDFVKKNADKSFDALSAEEEKQKK